MAIDGVASFNMLRIICISYLSASVGKRESLTTADPRSLNSCLLCSIIGCKVLSRFDCSSSMCWSALGVIHPLIADEFIIRPYNTKATTLIPLNPTPLASLGMGEKFTAICKASPRVIARAHLRSSRLLGVSVYYFDYLESPTRGIYESLLRSFAF